MGMNASIYVNPYATINPSNMELINEISSEITAGVIIDEKYITELSERHNINNEIISKLVVQLTDALVEERNVPNVSFYMSGVQDLLLQEEKPKSSYPSLRDVQRKFLGKWKKG